MADGHVCDSQDGSNNNSNSSKKLIANTDLSTDATGDFLISISNDIAKNTTELSTPYLQ